VSTWGVFIECRSRGEVLARTYRSELPLDIDQTVQGAYEGSSLVALRRNITRGDNCGTIGDSEVE